MDQPTPGVPAGFSTVTPYLVVNPAADAIDFYKRAFGAVETFRLGNGRDGIAHAEIRIGNSYLMLTDGSPDYQFMKSTSDLGGSPVQIYLYLTDADSVYSAALAEGAEAVMPVEDQADGDRRGGVRDPFGIIWWIATAKDPEAREKIMSHQANT